jgi:hypothetical protein
LGIDHVPVVWEARIVDLQNEPGIDDRPVFLAHRFGRRGDEILLAAVVQVLAARET